MVLYKNGTLNPFILSIASGLLLIAAWPVSPLTPLIFIAWVPLLLVSETENRIRFFLYAILTMFTWNAGTTWWIWNSTGAGATGAIIANSFLMTIPLWGYHIIKTRFGKSIGLISFVAFWLSFEYIHLNWQLSWPWLTLGNVFAIHPNWVQWYEYTGTSGGSLWVLLVNVCIFKLVQARIEYAASNNELTHASNVKKKANRQVIALALLLIIPLSLSYLILSKLPSTADLSKNSNATNVVILQPNVDPYNEKFIAGNTDAIIQKMITLSESKVDSNTRLVIWPETALPVAVWQDRVMENLYYQPIAQFVNSHPGLTLLTGIETFKNYGHDKATITARLNENDETYYDGFNAAVVIKAGQPLQFYNKSKLVPGVETLPDFLLWLGPIFEKFGGTTGGYGKDKESAVFKVEGNPYVAAPIICYESIYGEYIASYVRKGANLLTIITNDGWWGNTPGHKQHLNFARLHAIETRRWVARSANTGISAVIDDKGALLHTEPWDKAAVIKYNIPAMTEQTFFVDHGDLISPIALVLTILLFAWNMIALIKKRMQARQSIAK